MATDYKKPNDSTITISELMRPSNANYDGKVHGGYVLSLLDQISYACASKHSGNYCVTASVDTVNFLQPIEIGELLTMKARVNYAGTTSMVIGIRVEAENITTGAKKHCNSSYFTMVAKNDAGKSVKVPGLILDTDDEVRRFVESLKRIETKKERKLEFDEYDFSSQQYIEELDNHNVKLNLKT